uniref:ABC transporter ATP-binding protein n=1 Tax=Trichocoleus desertorum TaxID=1481672 RepID=UPI0025B523D0|nr:ABC transporter ATP-binding protein [Trichocoleus desertorum]
MSDTVIRVENLGKKYIIGRQKQERYLTLRDAIAQTARSVGQHFSSSKHKGKLRLDQEEFWALKDVAFEIKQGDRVGIIGRNGAGKSTLLKILSRITEPTTGRISIKGRVASLLEVGTGFHPELTGRENIFLNGAILGMGKTEISKKFDEIVAFAEVENFLDTPVKRYSSGMYVRLAFAVAAHLEPEILIVDEVLAVGDAQFQKKCLGKMEDVGKEGRTVIFVSHNTDSIRRLCSSGVYLSSGMVQDLGSIDYIVNQYLEQFHTKDQENSQPHIIYFDNRRTGYSVKRIEILEIDKTAKEKLYTWDSVRFRIVFHSPSNLNNGSVVVQISTLSGAVLTLCSTQPDSSFPIEFKKGINHVDCVFPRLMLSAGKYFIGVGLAIPHAEWLYREFEHGVLQVLPRDVFNSRLAPLQSRYVVPQEHTWEV